MGEKKGKKEPRGDFRRKRSLLLVPKEIPKCLCVIIKKCYDEVPATVYKE